MGERQRRRRRDGVHGRRAADARTPRITRRDSWRVLKPLCAPMSRPPICAHASSASSVPPPSPIRPPSSMRRAAAPGEGRDGLHNDLPRRWRLAYSCSPPTPGCALTGSPTRRVRRRHVPWWCKRCRCSRATKSAPSGRERVYARGRPPKHCRHCGTPKAGARAGRGADARRAEIYIWCRCRDSRRHHAIRSEWGTTMEVPEVPLPEASIRNPDAAAAAIYSLETRELLPRQSRQPAGRTPHCAIRSNRPRLRARRGRTTRAAHTTRALSFEGDAAFRGARRHQDH